MGIKYTGKSLTELAGLVEEIVERKNKIFLRSLWSDLVDGTPVATGAARSNWFVTPGRPSTNLNPRDGTRYSRPKEPDLDKYKRKFGKWYIVNNSRYIVDLNNGSSRRAPAGWIDASIQRNVIKYASESFEK